MKKRKKDSKSLEVFKKGFRKNEVVIYAIALMLVTAGYFNYTANLDNNGIETYSDGVQVEENIIAKEESKEKNEDKIDKEDSKKDNEPNIENEDLEVDNENKIAKVEENKNEEKTNDEDIGDAKLVNSNSVATDYFAESKLKRDTSYADMISTYTKIIEDSSVSETQKSIAMKEITKITDIKNSISVCENILSTKGFDNYVVFVNNESVNVVVQVKETLTKEKVAQIQNIVSRELNSEIENIHITQK